MIQFIVEDEAYEGVKRISEKIKKDFEKICPEILSRSDAAAQRELIIIFATLDKSSIVKSYIDEGKYNPSKIINKCEVYEIKFIDDSTLLIVGSDKRGTIYGMFALSEYIGVSPLHFWGDVEPVKRERIEINKDIETVSKEPSVTYRGFFINDEWPCFGTWTNNHFNGFTAEMYDHVFELLLRLKGNYIWPAMWASAFATEGPDLQSYELADIYGVVVGASHHEPCLRAGEEYSRNRGKDSKYGDAWNYYANKEGIDLFWEDSIKERGHLESIITIGMRGEADSTILGENSTIEENIQLLKDVITKQKQIIEKFGTRKENEQMLAVYKEVEDFFWTGLKNWSGLKNTILMLCEDNFGFTRALPTKELRDAGYKFGMYYHFDYHGGPISYEWMPSTSFERTWEQMSMAYDYGIKDIWIVNVGDLKFNEVNLAYFLTLSYDFEKWGTTNPNSIDAYTTEWLKKTFPSVQPEIREKMGFVLHSYIRMNAKRRPEALNSEVYHPCHYLESHKMLSLAQNIETVNEEIFSYLNENETIKNAYYSLIYLPAKASINLLRMHLYSGLNFHYAKQGKKIANIYADKVTECLDIDKNLMNDFGNFRGGKWRGMELEEHIGFTKWNDFNCRNPLRTIVEPHHKPRLCVTRKDRPQVYSKTYGHPETILIDDFLSKCNDKVILEIANDGIGILDFSIEFDNEGNKTQCDWLKISATSGSVEYQTDIELTVDRGKLSCTEIKEERLFIKDGDAVVLVYVKAKNTDVSKLPEKTFLSNNGVIVIPSNQYFEKKDIFDKNKNLTCAFTELKNYGRSGVGMKVYPTTSSFKEKEESPSLSYRFLIEENGEYIIEFWTTPTNPTEIGKPIRFSLKKDGKKEIVTTVPSDFKAGNTGDSRWAKGVLDNIRKTKTKNKFKKGVQSITIGALEPGLILEKILIYGVNTPPLESYLGP